MKQPEKQSKVDQKRFLCMTVKTISISRSKNYPCINVKPLISLLFEYLLPILSIDKILFLLTCQNFWTEINWSRKCPKGETDKCTVIIIRVLISKCQQRLHFWSEDDFQMALMLFIDYIELSNWAKYFQTPASGQSVSST